MRTETLVEARTLVRALTFTLCAVVAGCGSGGGGTSAGGGGGGAPGSRIALETTAVSGPNVDSAIGDTGVLDVTGTLPAATAIAHPVLTPEATAIDGSGQGTIPDSDGGSTDVHVVSAGEIDFTDHTRLFDASGDATATTATGSSQNAVLPFVAPTAPGFYELTVSAVTATARSVTVGQKVYAVISASGMVSVESDNEGDQSLLPLIAKAGAWKAQVSSANSGGNVITTTITFSGDFSSGTYVFSTAGAVSENLAFTAVRLTVPTTVTGLKTGAASTDYIPGNATGFTTTAYALAHLPARTAQPTTINAAATTLTVGTDVFVINGFRVNNVGKFELAAVRFFTDPTLPFTSKQVFESIFLTVATNGAADNGSTGVGYALAFDPTPDNNNGHGGATGNDILLGEVNFAP